MATLKTITPAEIEAMKAGPELDALVIEMIGASPQCTKPSVCIEEAWPVLTWLAKLRNGRYEIRNAFDDPTRVIVRMQAGVPARMTDHIQGPPAEAICRAALMVYVMGRDAEQRSAGGSGDSPLGDQESFRRIQQVRATQFKAMRQQAAAQPFAFRAMPGLNGD